MGTSAHTMTTTCPSIAHVAGSSPMQHLQRRCPGWLVRRATSTCWVAKSSPTWERTPSDLSHLRGLTNGKNGNILPSVLSRAQRLAYRNTYPPSFLFPCMCHLGGNTRL